MDLFFDRNRLVKREGYEILIHNLEDLSFYQDDNLIYMDVVRNNQKFTFLLTYYVEKEEAEEKNEEIEQ